MRGSLKDKMRKEYSRRSAARGRATERNASIPKKNVTDSWEIILVNAAEKPENQMTSFEKMELIEAGISKKDLENLKEYAGLDYEKLSEKIVALADIYSYGYEVFEDKNKFNEWIFTANSALGGKRPYDLLNNSFGREEVKHLIGRIDYGVYS
jgi:putative toxin-antitoxin system antitoxin component (TIGR02293 family)